MGESEPYVTITFAKGRSCRISLNKSFVSSYPTSSVRFRLNHKLQYELVINQTGNLVSNNQSTWSFIDNIEARSVYGKYLAEEVDENCFELIKT